MATEYWIVAIDPTIVACCAAGATGPEASSAAEAGEAGDALEGDSVVRLHQLSVDEERSDAPEQAATG